MTVDILPDSRARDAKGSLLTKDGNVVPVYCANCGAAHGYVPDSLITHVFALCERCLETHGAVAHHYREPETIFWERLANAMNEENVFTPEQIQHQLEDPSSTFSRLKNEWDHMVLEGKIK
jgi:hypothetical protein